MSKVIYVTGAPAAGKSSTTRMLLEREPRAVLWEYGARLTEHVRARAGDVSGQDDLRARSAAVVTPEDVVVVDRALLAFVEEHRGRRPVLVDSHPVTREEYGFRVTAFRLDQVFAFAPDEIWVLYAAPDETRRRIAADAGGRPMVDEEQARMHTAMQAAVATTYGVVVGCPVYLFDTLMPRDELVGRLVARLA